MQFSDIPRTRVSPSNAEKKNYVTVCFMFENMRQRVFVVKSKGYIVAVLTYVYVRVCIYAREIKIQKETECVSEKSCRAENESVKRQETPKRKKVVSESMEYIRIGWNSDSHLFSRYGILYTKGTSCQYKTVIRFDTGQNLPPTSIMLLSSLIG